MTSERCPFTIRTEEPGPGGCLREVRGTGAAVVGDVKILQSFDYAETSYGAPGIQLRMHVEVVDGRPRCTEVAFRVVHEQAAEVPAGVVRDFKLADKLVQACQCALVDLDEEVWAQSRESDNTIPDKALMPARARTRKAVEKSMRRGYPEDMLREVAAIYLDNIESFPTRAVREAFGVAQSTAQLYVKKAREKDFIKETVTAPRGGRP